MSKTHKKPQAEENLYIKLQEALDPGWKFLIFSWFFRHKLEEHSFINYFLDQSAAFQDKFLNRERVTEAEEILNWCSFIGVRCRTLSVYPHHDGVKFFRKNRGKESFWLFEYVLWEQIQWALYNPGTSKPQFSTFDNLQHATVINAFELTF